MSSVLCYLWLTAVSFLLSSRPRRLEESHWGSGSLWPSLSFSRFGVFVLSFVLKLRQKLSPLNVDERFVVKL